MNLEVMEELEDPKTKMVETKVKSKDWWFLTLRSWVGKISTKKDKISVDEKQNQECMCDV